MIPCPAYQGKTIAVFGLGKTGVAAGQALKAAGAKVMLWDDKRESCEALPVELASAVMPIEQWDWEVLDALLLSPGIPLTHPKPHAAVEQARAHNVPITSDIELLFEAQPNATYIAITGTNGKSTTTALVGHILQQAGRSTQVGGNIGTPALAMDTDADIYVLELSSFQLDLLRATKFNIAVWLNLSIDHLDRHGDMDGYVAAKKHIFDRQGEGDVAVVGVDDAYSEAVCRELIAEKAQRVVPIMTAQTSEQGVWVKDGVLHTQGEELDLNPIETLRGQHNHQNAAAAYAACRAAGLSHDEIASGMASFAGLAHRMQKVGEHDGIGFINDSKATNADAAARSLGSFEDIHWIVGGVPKAGGIEPLAPYFPRIRKAYLIGQAQDAFAKTLEGHVSYVACESLQAATEAAFADATAAGGGVVLLAPACASFDQFPNFELRGDAFVTAVRKINKGAGHAA